MLWNALPDSVKCTDSLSSFKRYLSRADTIVPAYYYVGKRNVQIIHNKLRLGMSDLNEHLYQRHLSDVCSCACGHGKEDAFHYLLRCPLFQQARNTFLLPYLHHPIQDLLSGKPTFTRKENESMFLAVQSFIGESGRFDIS